MNENEMRAVIRERVAASSYRRLGDELGVSWTLLHSIVHGRRAVSEDVARALGYRRVRTTVYLPLEEPQRKKRGSK